MKSTTVIFDLFGTLVDDFVSAVGQMHVELAEILAVPYEPFMELWRQTTEMRTIGAFETVEANIEYVCAAMGACASPEQIRKATEIRLRYIRLALRPKPDALPTLRELKNCGHRRGLISNCTIEIPIVWQDTAFVHLIESPVFSCREHLKKPAPRIYELACERLGVEPEDCLYIADGENHELAGAAEVGLHPVLIRTSSEGTRGELHQEAKDWQGPAIGGLAEVLQLVRS